VRATLLGQVLGQNTDAIEKERNIKSLCLDLAEGVGFELTVRMPASKWCLPKQHWQPGHAVERRTSLRFVSPKFGNISKNGRRLSANISATRPIWESRDGGYRQNSPVNARYFRNLAVRIQRPDWLAGASGFEPRDGGIESDRGP
jgi:hypothetical protein